MKRRWWIITLLAAGLCVLLSSCINVDKNETQTYTVTFLSEGTTYDVKEYFAGMNVEFPDADPVKDEDDAYTYLFRGWSRTENGTAEEEGAVVNSDMTYHAVFVAQPKQPETVTYTVTFLDGITGEVLKTEKVEKGEDALPPEAPVHSGYTFTKWSGDYTNVTARVDVTATYEKNSYVLIRNYLGKSLSETLFFGDDISLASIELPQGLRFDGWYTSETYEQTVEEAYPDGMPAADESGTLDIYAKYSFDFGSASLSLPQIAVYGGDPVRVQTTAYPDVAYSFEWSDTDGEWSESSDSASFAFRRAGEQTVSVRVTADYADGAFTQSAVISQTVTVAKRALTVGLELESDTIVYGAAPRASVIYDGFYGNEEEELTKDVKVVYLLGEERFDGSRLSAGRYTVTPEGADFANYEYILPEKSLTVQKAALTVKVAADGFTYGGSAEPSVSFEGFVYGEGESALSGSPVFDYRKEGAEYAEERFTAGEYEVSVSGYASDNYEIAYTGDTFTVAKKSAGAALTAEDITYGEGAQFGFALTGVVEGDEAKFVPAYSVTKGRESVSAEKLGAGKYSLTATFADGYVAANYELSVTAASFTVAKAALTVGASAGNKTYTYGDVPTIKTAIAGLVWGESASALGGRAEFTYTKNGAPYTAGGNFGAGSYTVAVSGYTSENYEISYEAPISFTVEKKALTLNVIMRSAALVYGDAVVGYVNAEGFVFGESLGTLGYPAVFYLNAEGERVTQFPASDSAYTATTEAESENYDIAIVSASFTVAKRALTVGLELESDTIVYGAAPRASVTYDGFYGNEEEELTKDVKVVYLLGEERFDGSRLSTGRYTVTPEGAEFANYEYTLPEKSLTVQKAALTVKVAADGFTYGGSAEPSVSFEGFVYGEGESALSGSPVFDYRKGGAEYAEERFTAGEYEVSVSGYASDNYEIAYTGDTFTVAKKSAGAALTAEDITYGEGAKFGFALTGVVEGDEAKFVPAYSVTKGGESVSAEKLGAGKYSLTATFADGYVAANYELSVTAASFTVAKAALAVGVSGNKTYTYGEAPSFNATFSGFVSDENEEALNGTAEFTYTKGNAPYTVSGNFGAGSYTVAVSGYTSENYEISYAQPVSFTVEKKALTLTVMTGKSVYVYGEEVTSEIGTKGFVFGESLGTLGYPAVFYLNAEGERVTQFPASESAYTATVEAQSENYDIAIVSASFTVAKRALTVGLELESDTIVYGAAPQASVTYEGFIGNEQEELTKDVKVVYLLGEERFDGSRLSAGRYTVTPEGADFANYEYTLPEKSLTVAKAALTVTVSADDFTYGGSAAPSVSFEGFVYGEGENVLGGTLVYGYTKNGAPYEEERFTAGGYMVAATGYSSENYEISYGSDTFTVAKKDLTVTVTAEKDSYTFGETVSAEWEASGLVFDDDKSALGSVSLVYYRDGQAYTGYPESKLFAAGSYTVGAEGFANENYNVTAQSDTFTVEKRQFVVYAFVSGPSGTQLSKTISFFETDDLFEFVGTVVLNTTEEGEYIAKDEESFAKYFFWQDGVCAIKVKGTGEDVTENFAFSYDLSFALSVQAFPGTITLPSQRELTYDGKERTFGIEIRGAEGTEYKVEYSVNGGEPSETAPLLTDAGVYTIRYFITAENYDGEDGSYTVTIKKAQATIGTVGVQTEYVYTGKAQTVLVGGKVTYTGDGVLTAADYAFTTVAEGNGHVITVSASEGKNYLAAEAKITLTVQKANYTVSAERQDYIYNRTAQGAAISVTAFGEDMFTVIYNGEAAVAQYTNAGTHTVAYTVSGNENYNDVSGEYEIVIAKAENVISADGVQTEYTYNGTQITVNSGASATYGEVVYSDNMFTNAGDYKVKLSVAESENYLAGSAEVQVTVKKADYAVTAPDQEYTYNATAQGAAISVTAFGEDMFTVIYNGEAAVAQYTNAGTHTVKYTVSGNENYNDASGSYTVTIGKAEVSVELPSNTSSTYDGTSFSAPVSVSAADSGYVVTYQCNGEPIDPETELVNAGTYVITYTVSGANYKEKTDSYTVTIKKAQATIGTVGVQTEYVYTGEAQTVLVGGKVTYTGDGVLTAADYTFTTVAEGNGHVITVSASEGKNYLAAEAKITLTVQKANYTVSAERQDYIYNRTAQGAAISVTAIGEDEFTVMYDGQAAVAQYTNAGTYTVKYTVSGNENYNDVSGEYNIAIAKAENVISTAGVIKTYTYNGTQITVNSGANATYGEVTYENNTFTNAGDHTVRLSVAESDNYKAASTTVTVTVNKAEVQIGSSYQYTYNGQAQGAISVNAPDSTYEISFSYAGGTYDTAPLFKDAGTYTVSYSVKASQNYAETNGSYTVIIAQAQLDVVNPGDQTYEYSGDPLGTGVTVEGAFDDGYTVTYRCNGETIGSVQFTDRGEYVITYTVSGKNYETVSGTFTVTIEKVSNYIDVSGVRTEYTYTGELITVNSGASALFGDVVYSDNTFTNAGSYTVQLSVAETENYKAASTTVTVTVNKADYTAGDIPENAVKDTDIVMGYNKTLTDVALNDGFSWADKDTALESGTFDAYYCGDPVNYNAILTQISITARKEKVTVTPNKNLEANYGITSLDNLAGASALGEGSRELSSEEIAQFLVVTTDADYSVGGTYLVTYTLKENKYYEATFEEGGTEFNTWLKIKSVLLSVTGNGNYYTVEDAISKAYFTVKQIIFWKEYNPDNIVITVPTTFISKNAYEVFPDLYSSDCYLIDKYDNCSNVLLVPFDGNYSSDRGQFQEQNNWEAVIPENAYSKLIVPSHIVLTVNGDLVVNAKRVATGATTSTVYQDQYGEMEVQEGAKIILENGSCFESLGFSYGEGLIEAKSGSNVYEPFNMINWKGGTISSNIMDTVFPLNQYTMSSLEVRTRFYSGANYSVKAAIRVNIVIKYQVFTADAKFISANSDSFLQSMSGYVDKWVDINNGEVHFDIYGNTTFNNLTVAITGYQLSTEGKQVPIPGNFTLTAYEGTITIPDNVQLKLLPGATAEIKESAVLKIASGGKVFGYGDGCATFEGVDQWVDGALGRGYPYSPIKQVYRQLISNMDYDATTPAKILIEGKVIVESGGVFAAGAYGINGGQMQFSEGSIKEGNFQEDNANSSETKYFTAYLTAKLIGGGVSVPEVGKTYLYGEGGWTVQ